MKFDLNDYVTVNTRIEEFYKKYPEGSIQTEIISDNDGKIIFKAYAFRNQEDTKPATGHAMEVEGSSYINKTSHVENAETSAVGRALAMAGFEIKKAICSREEVENAVNNQNTKKVISKEQAKKLFDLTNDIEAIKKVLGKYNYKASTEIISTDYDKIFEEIKKLVKK